MEKQNFENNSCIRGKIYELQIENYTNYTPLIYCYFFSLQPSLKFKETNKNLIKIINL